MINTDIIQKLKSFNKSWRRSGVEPQIDVVSSNESAILCSTSGVILYGGGTFIFDYILAISLAALAIYAGVIVVSFFSVTRLFIIWSMYLPSGNPSPVNFLLQNRAPVSTYSFEKPRTSKRSSFNSVDSCFILKNLPNFLVIILLN